ncbi:MAG: hypothetical protein QNK37_27650 [Acidobacteriota bacterium]|nr:hypothetical protein [Acidobacteriota bacterium]
MKQFFLAALTCLIPVYGAGPYLANFERGNLTPQSMGTLTFGPEGILFVGDSIGARIYALDLGDREAAEIEKPQTILDLEGTIGAAIGVPAADVMVHDMAVNPISKNTYLSVSRGRANWNSSFELPNDLANAQILLKLTPQGKISQVKMEDVNHTALNLPNPVSTDAKHRWKKVSARVDAVSDLVYKDNKLYVAGLSNEEFASTLRVFDFPFTGKGTSTSVEVYHGAHGKYETQAPIRAMLPYNFGEKSYVLAAYLCTPLALFPNDQLTGEGKVRGTTVSELGSGNYPTDMLHFNYNDKDFILVSNTNRTLMVFKPDEIQKQMAHPITERVRHRAGVNYTDISGTNVQQMDLLGNQHVQVIQRVPSGKLSLYGVSMRRFAR